MVLPIAIDIAILALLAICAIRGAYRGLVLSLCGLVAVILAFVGAGFLADAAAPVVAKYLEPKFAAAIETRLLEQMNGADSAAGVLPTGSPEAPASLPPETPGLPGTEPREFLLQDVLDVLKDMGLYQDLIATIENAVDQGMTEVAASAAAAVAAAIARSVAYTIIFLVAFVVILLLWTVLSHALDLVSRLPGLNTLNRTGGALFGLLKGCILLFLCAWVLRYSGNLIPEETVAQTQLLRFFLHTNPMALLLSLLPQSAPVLRA